MKIVLAGEDTVKRSQREVDVLRGWQERGCVVERFDLAKTDPEELLARLGTVSMFEQPKALAVTGWEKLRSPKQQAALLAALAESPDDVVLTSGKDPTPGQKKLLTAPWKLELFPLPKSVFALCDALGTKPYAEVHRLLRRVMADGAQWWLNAQLARTLHALLQAKAGLTPPGAPFQVQKWKKQSAAFSEEQLHAMLSGLFVIESRLKSGQTRLSWDQQFDILLAKLYDDAH